MSDTLPPHQTIVPTQPGRPPAPGGVNAPDAHELSTTVRVTVARLSRRLRSEKADDELSDSQISALSLIVREGPKTLSALADHERVTAPSMNRTVNGLVASGHATREDDPTDRRRVVITPTGRGRELVVATRAKRDAWLYERMRELTDEDRAVIERAAAALREIADS